jgi:lysozyme
MNEDNHLTTAGGRLIQHFEGCLKPRDGKYHAYECPAGVWTIGWGTTTEHGHPVKKGMVWTRDQCDDAFIKDMEQFERAVRRNVTVHLMPWQFDALVSFTYNVGEGNLKKSTLLKKVNALDFAGAAQEFHKWNKAGGKTMAGLTRRRASESLLFQNIPDANYDGKADPKPPAEPMPQAVDEPGDEA